MASSRLTLPIPESFDFMRTARSHGWYDLPPFSLDVERRELRRVVLVDGTLPAECTVKQAGKQLVVTCDTTLDIRRRRQVAAQVRSCLRMDEEFGEFHREARRHPHYRWIAQTGSGRMLRSPTVFEDTVKMLCTTNCTWTLTKVMVGNLVQEYGIQSAVGTHAFPSAEAIAGATEAHLRKRIKAGYRSPFLLNFAESVASGRLDVESWRNSPLSTGELFNQIRNVKGLGPYAAGNILKLLGRYDYLGLDSWVRMKYYELYTRGRKVRDAAIERRYRRLGKWRGLFFWLEMTRYWHEEKFGDDHR